uniref:POP1 domain-containing protein n=1 Tax=Haemonchus contortus TaxID=6289 RepID=A0A7I4YRI0_HAECO
MPSSTPCYDYNEIEDVVDKARYRRPPRRRNEQQATHVKRDIRRYHYPSNLSWTHLRNPPVEYSLDKKKRWEEIKETHENPSRNPNQAIVDLCTPFRGSIWWHVLSGGVDVTKINQRLLSKAAVKGKSKNITLVSHYDLPNLEEPILKFSIVRCHTDSTYHSQLLKYRRHLDRAKRRCTSKIHRNLEYDDDEI